MIHKYIENGSQREVHVIKRGKVYLCYKKRAHALSTLEGLMYVEPYAVRNAHEMENQFTYEGESI